MIDVLRIHPSDNVCVALRPLPAGTHVAVSDTSFVLNHPVPLGAKMALKCLKAGDKIIKFGEPIGSLTSDAEPGTYVHTHNLESDYLHTFEVGELVSGAQRSRS